MKLYSYFRSSASYRVRIALNLKKIPHETDFVHLLKNGGEQRSAAYAALNPQKLVPALATEEGVFTQSLAIIEYLEETHPETPLLPATAAERARVRAIAQLMACDIHPLNNLRVLQYFEQEWSVPQPERDEWVRHWIGEGFAAAEAMVAEHPSTGSFCEGNTPTMADCCLVPQVYNARRFGVDMARFPTLQRIEAACLELPAFDAARPERQPDAPEKNR